MGLATRAPSTPRTSRATSDVFGRVVYWLVILVVALALVAGLILVLESLDRSAVGQGALLHLA